MVLAFAMAIVPFPPVNVFSLIISFFNLLLILKGRLARSNFKTVLISVLLACLSIWLFFYFFGGLNKSLFAGLLDFLAWVYETIASYIRHPFRPFWVETTASLMGQAPLNLD